MLGHKLLQIWHADFEVATTIRGRSIASPLSVLNPGVQVYDGVSVEDYSTVERALTDFKPDAVVNCVGIVKQLEAARDPAQSIRLNALFPHQLAQTCEGRGARLIHISTDCVFAGRGGPYRESDPADADDLYGRSKRLGEVDKPGCCTVRTSIIGRELVRGTGLLEWFLRHEGPELQGYRHALYTGFTTNAFAGVLRAIIVQHPQLEGVWHVSSEPIDKYELLNMVNDVYGKGMRVTEDVEFKCDRRLDSGRFRRETGFAPPSWREMIEAMHADPTDYEQLRRAD